MDDDPTTPEPGAPSDNTTLVAILACFEREGFTVNMFVTEDAMVRCGACRQDTAPEDLELDRLRRVEGASDPSDMAAVLGITCRRCGAKGTAITRFGPEADAQDGQVLLALDDQRFGNR